MRQIAGTMFKQHWILSAIYSVRDELGVLEEDKKANIVVCGRGC